MWGNSFVRGIFSAHESKNSFRQTPNRLIMQQQILDVVVDEDRGGRRAEGAEFFEFALHGAFADLLSHLMGFFHQANSCFAGEFRSVEQRLGVPVGGFVQVFFRLVQEGKGIRL